MKYGLDEYSPIAANGGYSICANVRVRFRLGLLLLTIVQVGHASWLALMDSTFAISTALSPQQYASRMLTNLYAILEYRQAS